MLKHRMIKDIQVPVGNPIIERPKTHFTEQTCLYRMGLHDTVKIKYPYASFPAIAYTGKVINRIKAESRKGK